MVLNSSLQIKCFLNQQIRFPALVSVRGPNKGSTQVVNLDFQQWLAGSGGQTDNSCWVPAFREQEWDTPDSPRPTSLPPVPAKRGTETQFINSWSRSCYYRQMNIPLWKTCLVKPALLNRCFLLSSQQLMKAITQMRGSCLHVSRRAENQNNNKSTWQTSAGLKRS